MNFRPNTLYHIYNQGNNRQPIFFKGENYLFFLRKMRDYLLPYGNLLCYCLMPNHFHWLFYVREVEVPVVDIHRVTQSHPVNQPLRSLNQSIAILLRSYTRAINKQENRSGALFREDTKAQDGWIDGFMYLSEPLRRAHFWNEFGLICFNYIHDNPVKAGLVARPEDWLYSSYQDFVGLRRGTLCHQALAKELLGLP